MLIVPIFVLPSENQGVYACVWPPDKEVGQNALERFVTLWTNTSHLKKTLNRMKKQLTAWHEYQSDPEEAILQVRDEAIALYEKVHNTQYLPSGSFKATLKLMFTNLTKDVENGEKKARAVEVAHNYPSPPLLRLYALEYYTGLYIITGGCFKAVRKSSQDPFGTIDAEIAKIREINTLLVKNAVPQTNFDGNVVSIS